ncbi:phospholipase D-like domain-containing protein [Terasakiella sp. SH-1]|uniref:phospholipase D-like domain-containing protein n=1 Tax=Terasakiella sp. SH-1 TaxID=2560057 RepID=UPI001072F49D|nr:phospholipase D-like domain-containing protein [Terasakiella sp. SH-1]
MSDPTYIDQIKQFLNEKFPKDTAHWGYSDNNSFAPDWLYATPTNVWGLPYDQFKQAVAGDSTDFHLQACTTAEGPTQQCKAVSATVTEPGAEPANLLVGHSYRIYDAIYDVMTSARVLLDFTTLTVPTGKFLTAFQNAITYLSNLPEDQRPVIRILYSNPLPNIPPLTAEPFLSEITKQLDPSKKMTIYVTVMSSSFSSWNHSKIVAADGKKALTGGHNVWGEQYLGKNPVFDVSMMLEGEAALDAHEYANSLWAFELARSNSFAPLAPEQEVKLHASYTYDEKQKKCVSKYWAYPPASLYEDCKKRFPPQPSKTGSSVLAIGRGADTRRYYALPTLSSFLFSFTEPSDEAILKAVSLAKKSIRMSLQAFRLIPNDIPGLRYCSLIWNENLFKKMGEALQRGVEMKIVLSNPNAVAGGLSATVAPYYGDNPDTVNAKMKIVLTETLWMTDAAATDLIKSKFRVASFRYSAQKTYPGDAPIPNHAKTFMVDDALFYIGSQNLYPANLNEFGYMVQDEQVVTSYLQNYWTPLWNFSSTTCTNAMDEDLETSEQLEAMLFIADLQSNTLSRVIWGELKKQWDETQDPAQKNIVQARMNEHISNSGFQTQATFVLEALKNPFFSENPPPTEATPEALRFVANVMDSTVLMAGFSKVVDQKTDTVEEANANINKFLKDNGYHCNALEILSAFNQMRLKVLEYWQGTYKTWVTDDGGKSYTLPENSARLLTQQPFTETEEQPFPQITDSLTVTSDGTVKLGDTVIVNPVYNNNSLTWEMGENETSANLFFGQVSRATLNEGFTGMEFFGTITYPQDSSGDFKGVYSIYGRSPQTPPGPNPNPDTKGWPTVVWVFGAIALGALLLALGCFIWKKVAQQRQRAEYGRLKKDDDAVGRYGEENPTTVTSPDREIELAELSRAQLQRRTTAQLETVEEMVPYEQQMSRAGRQSLSESANKIGKAQTDLFDPPANEMASVVQTQMKNTYNIQESLNELSDSEEELFSSETTKLIQEKRQVSVEVGKTIKSFEEDRAKGEPFEFEEE